jgi:hypothetical protein
MSLIAGLTALALVSAPAIQTPPQQQRPEMLERLTACRAVTDSVQRLACYDAAAAAFDDAERQGDLVVIDRAAVSETRRQLFGFELPTLPRLFSGGDADEIDAIETTLERAFHTSERRWTFRLADGSVWRQIDSEPVRFDNDPGEAVRVRKASLGSFLLTVGGSRAVRVRRQ